MANVVTMLLDASVKAPTGLWETILNWIEKGVVNYGWVIILFTLLIKVCMSPLDFLVRWTSKKQTLVQQKLAPQIARINKKYANDPTQAKMQINTLYKREGAGTIVSCLVMIVNLVLTLVVFFTLFASLRKMSAYKAITQYDALQNAYVTEYTTHLDEVKADFKVRFEEYASTYHDLYAKIPNEDGTFHYEKRHEDIYYQLFEDIFEKPTTYVDENGETQTTGGLLDNFYGIGAKMTDYQIVVSTLYFHDDKTENDIYVCVQDLLLESGKIATDPAGLKASEVWKDVKDSWLWIGNIWVADNYKSPLPTYNDLAGLASSSKIKEYKTYVANIDKDLYGAVTSAVHEQNSRWNGYFILAVFAGVLSFLSQWISELMNRPKDKRVNEFINESNPQGGAMKFMKILLPVLMVIFVLTSSAAFGLYIVVSSLISIGLSALIGVIVNACFKKKQTEIYEQLEKETLKSLKKSQKRR